MASQSITFSETTKEQMEKMLAPFGQEHLVRFWDEIDVSQKHDLYQQISAIDLPLMASLHQTQHQEQDWGQVAKMAESPPAITLSDFADADSYQAAYQTGAEALSSGKVGLILVAGGQGTRLGFDQPKGMYPIGPISQRTLFECHFDLLAARAKQFGHPIPVYVMTSPATDQETIGYFQQQDQFGFPAKDFTVFCQGSMPALDFEGKLLMSDKDQIFFSPDGHGGMLAALQKSRLLDQITDRGIEYLFYAQVDNPLAQLCDPALIGFHIQRQSEMTTQVVRKYDPLQRVGNVVKIGDHLQIVEYSDLPDEQAHLRNCDGSLKLWAGSIAVHIFDTEFLRRCAADVKSLPFHRAVKKVPFVNLFAKRIEPTKPNAVKFEKFIFDLLPHARQAIVCEVDPADGFCAVKNSAPANSETPQHVQQAIVDLHRRWLQQAGVKVLEGVKVEINPKFAIDFTQLKQRLKAGSIIEADTYFSD